MSRKRQTWTQRVMVNSQATGKAYHTLLIMAQFADPEGHINVTPGRIAAIAHSCIRTIRRHIRELVQIGELWKTRKGGGHGQPNMFMIRLPDEANFWEIEPLKDTEEETNNPDKSYLVNGDLPGQTNVLVNGCSHPEVPTEYNPDTDTRARTYYVERDTPPGDQPGPNEISPFSEDAES